MSVAALHFTQKRSPQYVLVSKALGQKNMKQYLYRYFKTGMNPFKSTSELADDEILVFMKENFPNHNWFHANPKQRIRNRRKVEKWLHEEFIKTGGDPKTEHPCYFTLGASSFLKNFESFDGESIELKIPLNEFSSKHISFTYPDSFFSEWLSRNQSHPLFNKDLNGRVFTLDGLLELLRKDAIPIDQFMYTSSYEYQFYIEAQVWNLEDLPNKYKV
ncbi:MAG: hypothetical protein QM484_06310 [Woeseiaceae bacterium]